MGVDSKTTRMCGIEMILYNDLRDNHGQLEHLHLHIYIYIYIYIYILVSQKKFQLYYHLPSTIHKSINLKSKLVHTIDLQFQTSTTGPPTPIHQLPIHRTPVPY